MIMLELHDIETGYGAGQVLFGVSLEVTAGACVSLMGRNGMGKTTTVRAIMGQLPLTSGRISRFGDDRSDRPSFDIARSGIGLRARGPAGFFEPKRTGKFANILPATIRPNSKSMDL